MNYMENVSKRIVELREAAGETQQELADAVGITRQSLSRYEIAARTINVDVLGAIAEHYNVSADYLLGLSDVKSTEQDIKIACEVTGLNEDAVKKFIFIKDVKNGNALTKETEIQVQETRENIAERTSQLEKMYVQHGGLKERLQSFLDSRPHKEWPVDDAAFNNVLNISCNIQSEREFLKYLLESEKENTKRYIETLNTLIESDGFFDFIKNLTIYSITDFQKKSKRIYSISTDGISEDSHKFIFNSSLIEQGLVAKMQQFISSLKQTDAHFYLADIEKDVQEDLL